MDTNRVSSTPLDPPDPAAATVRSAAGGGATDDADRVARAIRDFRRGIDRERSFAVLFEGYHRRVERFFARKGFGAEDCLDLTQETFLRVYKGLEGFRGEARFATWLFGVATKLYLKRLRFRGAAKRSGHEVPVTGEDGKERSSPELSTRGSQLGAVLDRERRRVIEEAVAELPDQMRRCLELRVHQELRYREIALVMKVSIDTVKSHLLQARRRLRERLGEHFGEGWDF